MFNRRYVHVHRVRAGSIVSMEEQLCYCALCQDVMKDPGSTSCNTSNWDQSTSLGDSSCQKCGQRLRTRPRLQSVSQTSIAQSKTVYLPADVLIFATGACCLMQCHLLHHTPLLSVFLSFIVCFSVADEI